MKQTIFFLCLCSTLLWSCSGGQPSESTDGTTAGNTTVVVPEKDPSRAARFNRRNRIPFEKRLEKGGLAFHLSSPNVPEENTLTASPSGFEVRNDSFQIMVEGNVTDAQLADLDKDGFPEVYAFARSIGPDSTAYVYAFTSYRNRSFGLVSVSDLSNHKEMAEGFNGHGRFYFENGLLKHSFPIYQEGKPSGKQRIVTYGLRQGEASFILEPVSSEVAE